MQDFQPPNISEALRTVSQLPIGESLNTSGFGIITSHIRDRAIALLSTPSPAPDWLLRLEQEFPGQAEELMHAIYLGASIAGNKGVGLRETIESETDRLGGIGLIFERMLAHGLNRSHHLNVMKTPHFIDEGGNRGPGLDIIINDKKRQIVWGLTTTIKHIRYSGVLSGKHREDISHLRSGHRELQSGEKSQMWYRNGVMRYPECYVPDRIMNLNFLNLEMDPLYIYWAYQEWSNRGYLGQLHDFLADPGRERLEYFYAIFDSLIEALSETEAIIPHVKKRIYPLSDNGEIRRDFIDGLYVFDLHMHDKTGFPLICTIHVPGGAGRRFMQNFFNDLEKLSGLK